MDFIKTFGKFYQTSDNNDQQFIKLTKFMAYKIPDTMLQNFFTIQKA